MCGLPRKARAPRERVVRFVDLDRDRRARAPGMVLEARAHDGAELGPLAEAGHAGVEHGQAFPLPDEALEVLLEARVDCVRLPLLLRRKAGVVLWQEDLVVRVVEDHGVERFQNVLLEEGCVTGEHRIEGARLLPQDVDRRRAVGNGAVLVSP